MRLCSAGRRERERSSRAVSCFPLALAVEATKPSFAVGELWASLAYDSEEPSPDQARNDQAGLNSNSTAVISGPDGERTQDAHRQRIINWISAAGGLAGAFDVTTKGVLHAVFERQEFWRLSDSSGKPPGVMGWWPSRAVTFIENHDTGSTQARPRVALVITKCLFCSDTTGPSRLFSQGHWKFPEGCELAGYAYILSHPGTPTIFWDHVFNWPHLKEPILRLVALRARAGVHCRSDVAILASEQAVYAACVHEVLCLKLGPGDWAPDDKGKWKVDECGDNWCTWELANR